jgi:hypothetical protein
MVSMVLTAAWVGLVGLACLALFLRRREMWPALAAFAVTAAVAGTYLGAETLIDNTVDEDVVTAQPSSRAEGGAEGAQRSAREGNVLLGRGRFESLEHETAGVAQVIGVSGRRRFLTLTRFETDNGPDLRVYLSTADANQDSAGDDFIDLGGLKGQRGRPAVRGPVRRGPRSVDEGGGLVSRLLGRLRRRLARALVAAQPAA